jgi:uncharacterized membrane protein
MSGLRNYLSNLSPARGMFLFCVALGVAIAILGGSAGGMGGSNLVFVVYAISTWLVLGLVFGGIAWVIDTVSLWRNSLRKRLAADRDPALQALKERYARGEIDENQFESMRRHLKENLRQLTSEL